MKKKNAQLTLVGATIAFILLIGCDYELVGAPCIPETDDRSYNDDLTGVTYSIETRSVQCETKLCLTRTELISEQADGVDQLKFSFCSCRCEDVEGNTAGGNVDKSGGLCECPPGSTCEPVLRDIEGAPKQVTGSYCIPNCIAEPCSADKETGEPRECIPSSSSEEPWKWECEVRAVAAE